MLGSVQNSAAACGGKLPSRVRLLFVQDYEEAGELWTQDLCEMDSDGDGLTNGEELGDPCCVWHSKVCSRLYFSSTIRSHLPSLQTLLALSELLPVLTPVLCG